MAEKIGLEAVLSLSSFSAAVSKYNSSLSGMGKQTTGIASTIGSSFASIGGAAFKMSGIVAGIGFAALATGLGAVVTTGLSFNNTMEQASAKINAFTKDAGLTADILEDVRKEAALTPFEFDAMANSVAGLLPAARQADVGIMDLLRDAEVLAASNPAEGLEGAAFALREAVSGDFTSVIERFNLPRTAINKLKDEGVPALEIVRQVMNDMGYDMDLVSALAATAEGRWSTLKDTFTNLAGTVTQPIFDTLSSSLGGINDLLTANAPQMQAFADLLAGTVAEGITIISAKAKELSAAFASGGAAGLVGALGITPDAIALIEKFRGMITQIADTIAGPFMTAFSDLSAGGILDSINQGITFLNDHFAELQGALTGIGAVLAAGVFAAIAAGLFALLTPVNLIIVAAATLGAAWAGNWGGIQEKTGAVVAYVTEQITALATVLTPAFNSIWDSITKVSAAFGAAGVDSSTLMTTLGAMGTFLVEVIIPAFVQFVGILAGTLAQAIAGIADGMIAGHNAFVTISGYITGTVIPVFLSMNDGISPVVDLLASLGDLINAVINKALQAMAGLWQNVLWPALQKVGQVLKDTLMPAFISLGQTIKSDVSPDLRELGDTVMPLLQEGLEFVNEAIQRTISFFKSLAETVNNISLPDWLQTHSPPPLADGLNLIADGAARATGAIAEMGRNLVTSGASARDFFGSLDAGGIAAGNQVSNWNDLRDILQLNTSTAMNILASGGGSAGIMDLVRQESANWGISPALASSIVESQGLMDHLMGTFNEFQTQMRLENLGNMLQMGGSFSGIAGTLADMLQAQMGNADEANKTVEAYQKLSDQVDTSKNKLATLQQELEVLTTSEGAHQIALDKKNLAIEKTTEAIEFNRRQLEIYEQELAGMQEGTLAWDKKKLSIDKTTEAIDSQSKQLITLKEELEKLDVANNADTLSIEKKRLEIEKLTAEMAKNQQAVIAAREDFEALATGSAADQIAFLQSFLESGADSIRLIGEELGGVFAGQGLTSDVYWTRVAAQERLAELLEEQRRQEELITQQKEAQGKLDKLKAQLDLINLGRQLGGDIFAGINFGLDASIEDLLAATNAVTMAMVDQINHDLQIHSPSGVMIKTFEQVMAGAALGVRRGESMLSDAMRSIPILNGSMPQFSQAAGISNSSTYNYNFPMTVNTAATAQGVVRQYDVRRSLANV